MSSRIVLQASSMYMQLVASIVYVHAAWRAWTKVHHESASSAYWDHSTHRADAGKQQHTSSGNPYQQFKQGQDDWNDAWQHFKGFQQDTSQYWHESFNASFESHRRRSNQQNQQSAAGRKVLEQQQLCMHTLGLPSTSVLDARLLKIAFLECAKKWHPDRHSDEAKPAAESKFKAAHTAYQHLLTCL